jgi:hypothetical protein
VTDAETAKLVAILLAAYPHARVHPQTSAAYERMLRDLSSPVAAAAVQRLIATSKYLPTIAEIREVAASLTVGEVAAGGEAWGQVLRAIRRYGAYRQPGEDFALDPLALRCVRALGWTDLCTSENAVADRARFIELYDRLAATERREQVAGHLPAVARLRELQAEQQGPEQGADLIAQVAAALTGGKR